MTMRRMTAKLTLLKACCLSALALPLCVPAADIQSELLIETGQSWDGAALPAYPDGAAQISIVRITLAPGVALPVHRHPVINAGIVLSGELTITTAAGDQKTIRAGDALVEVVDTWHYGRNSGAVPTELVVFYAGTTGGAITEMKPGEQ